MNTKKAGYSALITVIIISAVLSILVISSPIKGLALLAHLKLTTDKEQSYYNALSCIQNSLFISHNSLHENSSTSIHLKKYACTINLSTNTQIKVTSIFNASYTTLQAEIDKENMVVISVKEVFN